MQIMDKVHCRRIVTKDAEATDTCLTQKPRLLYSLVFASSVIKKWKIGQCYVYVISADQKCEKSFELIH